MLLSGRCFHACTAIITGSRLKDSEEEFFGLQPGVQDVPGHVHPLDQLW